jgi:hypothetical protein
MNRLVLAALLVLLAGAGCARKVVLAPELAHSRNDPDWVIRAQPAPPAPPAPAAAAPAPAPAPAPITAPTATPAPASAP